MDKSSFITWQPGPEDVAEGGGVRDGQRGGVPRGDGVRGDRGCHRSAGPFIEDLMDAL